MIIFSADPEPFRTENSIEMYREIDTLPNVPNTTLYFIIPTPRRLELCRSTDSRTENY